MLRDVAPSIASGGAVDGHVRCGSGSMISRRSRLEVAAQLRTALLDRATVQRFFGEAAMPLENLDHCDEGKPSTRLLPDIGRQHLRVSAGAASSSSTSASTHSQPTSPEASAAKPPAAAAKPAVGAKFSQVARLLHAFKARR